MATSSPFSLPPDPSLIMQLATGYWASATLLAAVELGLFRALAGGPLTVEDTAAAIKADFRNTGYLLDALCGLGLLSKTEDRYTLTSASQAFLVPGQPGSLESAIVWARDQYEVWGRLADTVRSGAPAVDPALHLGDDPEQTRAFALAMHERAAGVARGVVGFIDLEDCHTLLDVGGGPGTYARLLAEKYPALFATVLDLPAIVGIASELIADAGISNRVDVRAGDATTGDYGESVYDAVLFSGVLHQMAPESIQRMLRGANKALTSGGRVIISDVMVDATGTQPVFATLFSLQMLLTTRDGAVFSAESCSSWLEAAGFRRAQAQRLPPPLPYTVIQATKA